MTDPVNPAIAREAMTDALEAEAVQWVGIANAATAQLVSVLGRAVQTGAWQGWGVHSPAQWAGMRFGLSPSRARRLVGIAEALLGWPEVAALFEAGEISEDHVAVIVRENPSRPNAAIAADLARHATVGQLRRAMHSASLNPAAEPEPEPDAESESEPESEPESSTGDDTEPQGTDPEETASEETEPLEPVRSSVSSWFDEHGGWQLRASGSATDGAVIERALRAAGDRLFAQRHGDDADPALRNDITVFDALRYLCQVGLDAMDPATATHPGRIPSERFVVNLHLNPAHPGTGRVHLGPLLPAHLRQEATCDALWRLWLEDDAGNVNLGRTARVVDGKLRTVLENRDGACRYPGCGRTKGLIAHHLLHWEHGGPTDTANLVMLCRSHHRGVHHGHFHVHGNPDHRHDADDPLRFTAPGGHLIGPLLTRLPDGPIADAARAAGMNDPRWHNRAGEPGQWDLVTWHDPRRDAWLAQHRTN